MNTQPNYAAYQRDEVIKFKESILLQLENAKRDAIQSLEKIKIEIDQQVLTCQASFNSIVSAIYASPTLSHAENQNDSIQNSSSSKAAPLDLSNKNGLDLSCNSTKTSLESHVPLKMDIDSSSSVSTQSPTCSPNVRSDQPHQISQKSVPVKSKEQVCQKALPLSPPQTRELPKKYKIPKVNSKLTTSTTLKKEEKRSRARSRSRSPVSVSQYLSKSVETNQRNKINEIMKSESSNTKTSTSSLNAENTETVNNLPAQSMPYGYHKYLMLKINCCSSNCNESFKSLSDLNAHMQTEHKSYLNKCPLRACETVGFESFSSLLKHIQTDHPKLEKWYCRKCSYFTTSSSKLYIHFYNYHQYGQYVCSVENCQLAFSYRGFAYKHFMNNHINFSSLAKRSTFVLKDNVKIRFDAIKTSTGEMSEESMMNLGSPEIFFCKRDQMEICSLFIKNEKCQSNMIKCISKSCLFECQHFNDLDNHFQEVHALTVCVENKCPLCNKSFDTRNQLADHGNTVHRCIAWYCLKCLTKTSSIIELNEHNIKFHNCGTFFCNYKTKNECDFSSNHRHEVVQHYAQKHCI